MDMRFSDESRGDMVDSQASIIDASQQLHMIEAAFRAAPVGIAIFDLQCRCIRVNEQLARLNGLPAADHIGRTVREVVPEFADKADWLFRKIIETKKPFLNIPFPDDSAAVLRGNGFWSTSWFPVYRDNCFSGIGVAVQEITRQKKAEHESQESEFKFRSLFESSPMGVFLVSPGGGIIAANPAACTMFGCTEQEFQKLGCFGILDAGDPHLESVISSGQHGDRICGIELTAVRKSGDRFPIDLDLVPGIERQQSSFLIVRDITDRKRAESAFHENEELLRLFVEHAPASLAMFDQEMRYIACSRRYLVDTGLQDKDLRGLPHYELFPDIPVRWREVHRRALGGEVVRAECDRVEMKDGTVKWLRWEIRPWTKLAGHKSGIVIFSEDITERVVAEQAMQKSERNYREIFDSVSDAVFVHDAATGSILDVNAAMLQMFEFSRQEALNLLPNDLCLGISPYSETEARQWLQRAYQEGCQVFQWQARKKSGSVFNAEVSLKRAEINGQKRVLALVRDITERKHAEEERLKLEAQLQQAHKMETVGRLAGGVAHDFNNMLSVILGHAELALMQLDGSHPVRTNIIEMQKAAQRSADLTKQLLAYARKQAVRPELLDLNEAVSSMTNMLARLIGENITMEFRPGLDLWPVKIDPAQINQILTNLAINARDAIATTGSLIIQTSNSVLDSAYCATHPGFLPGAYVLLKVSDDGCGMDEETASHIFEPFFTTKDVGKGTGLGLATVLGIVQQNSGLIGLLSQIGKGTTFEIYFPRATL